MKVSVERPEDWAAIARIGGPVVDPMILRCGELFLRGAGGAKDAIGAWDLLTKNIHALGTFFDRLVLDEAIPVFNYADTFDLDQNFSDRALSRVNAREEILVDVNVAYAAYQEVKKAALTELKKLYGSDGRRIEAKEAHSILHELTTSGYAWQPQLGDLELRDDAERRLAAFLLGGLIFGGYAQRSDADHLMQPKRSRLFLALSLGQPSSQAEDHLFKRLGTVVGHAAELPYAPTFFPMLLSNSNGPAELLKSALELRASAEARDYRHWLRAALDDFNVNGRISVERSREVAKIAQAIQRRLDGIPMPQVEVKMTVADVIGHKPPGVDVNLTEPAQRLWGWVIEQLPGKRHRKLLSRAIIAQHEYVELDRRVKTVWQGNGVA